MENKLEEKEEELKVDLDGDKEKGEPAEHKEKVEEKAPEPTEKELADRRYNELNEKFEKLLKENESYKQKEANEKYVNYMREKGVKSNFHELLRNVMTDEKTRDSKIEELREKNPEIFEEYEKKSFSTSEALSNFKSTGKTQEQELEDKRLLDPRRSL